MKHTPGKWEAGKAYKQDKNQWFAVVFAPDKTDKFHSPRAAEALGATKEETEANAALIAAAPGLFNALVTITSFISAGGVLTETHDHIKNARAAIAKAEGRE